MCRSGRAGCGDPVKIPHARPPPGRPAGVRRTGRKRPATGPVRARERTAAQGGGMGPAGPRSPFYAPYRRIATAMPESAPRAVPRARSATVAPSVGARSKFRACAHRGRRSRPTGRLTEPTHPPLPTTPPGGGLSVSRPELRSEHPVGREGRAPALPDRRTPALEGRLPASGGVLPSAARQPGVRGRRSHTPICAVRRTARAPPAHGVRPGGGHMVSGETEPWTGTACLDRGLSLTLQSTACVPRRGTFCPFQSLCGAVGPTLTRGC
jgi:hypothetical protein